jgi:hypothetical protein
LLAPVEFVIDVGSKSGIIQLLNDAIDAASCHIEGDLDLKGGGF